MENLPLILALINQRNFKEVVADEEAMGRLLAECDLSPKAPPDWFHLCMQSVLNGNETNGSFPVSSPEISDFMTELEELGWDIDDTGEDVLARFPCDGMELYISHESADAHGLSCSSYEVRRL